jgi:hypothetical protein
MASSDAAGAVSVRSEGDNMLPGLADIQPAFEVAEGFSVFTSALFDVTVDVGMLTAPPAGQNVHRFARVSIRGIVEDMNKLSCLWGDDFDVLSRW